MSKFWGKQGHGLNQEGGCKAAEQALRGMFINFRNFKKCAISQHIEMASHPLYLIKTGEGIYPDTALQHT